MADRNGRQLKKAEEKQQEEAGLAAAKDNAGIEKSRKVHSEKPKEPGKRGGEPDGVAVDSAELNEQLKEQLRRAANLALGEACLTIAQGLMNKTIAGDARCATLLFALAEPKDDKASAGKKRRIMKLVEELANEQEWPSEMSEAAAVMFEGGPGTRTETVVVPAATTG